MNIKGTKPKPTAGKGTNPRSAVKSILPVEDDERHAGEVHDYIARNRDALNASIRRSRGEIADGKKSSKTIETIIAERRSAVALSADAFAKIWNNPDDNAYDGL